MSIESVKAARVAMWLCIVLFFARVTGQIEVLLMSPSWLPPMSAWYSGLLPYPLLVPAQLLILMLMCIMTATSSRRGGGVAGTRMSRAVSAFALLYAVVMAVRLLLIVYRYGEDFYLHGAIPVAFHWVLALFLLLWAGQRRVAGSHERGFEHEPHCPYCQSNY